MNGRDLTLIAARRFRFEAVAMAVFILSLGTANLVRGNPAYSIFDIGAFPGQFDSYAYGINASGQVTGMLSRHLRTIRSPFAPNRASI